MAHCKKIKQENKLLVIHDPNLSLHDVIYKLIMENGFLIKEHNWSIEQMEIRATYDAFRITNLVNKHLNS